MLVYIDVDILEELEAEVRRLMNHYVYNPNGSDYCCEFCGETERPAEMRIPHREDCNGVRYLREISSAKTGENGPTRIV